MPSVGGLNPGQYADYVIIRDTHTDPYQRLIEAERSELRAVVRNGRPLIADPDFADWFRLFDMASVAVTLDGRPKLLAKCIAQPAAVVLEPGLDYE